jgi:2-keto-4-pentenoate hydratase/2-oxohepta-3-ene-1,7-dioic acid hydratase in catechol pathway
MQLCTFTLPTPLGRISRLGVAFTDGTWLDANLAHALMLTEREQHPCAQALADVLVPADMMTLLSTGQFGLHALQGALHYWLERGDTNTYSEHLHQREGTQLLHAGDNLQLLAPLPRPRSIRDGVGFLDHLRNAMSPNPIPEIYEQVPAIYYKGNVNSVIGPNTDIMVPRFGDQLDYELEVAAVIGRQGTNISPNEALDYVFGYTIFNDVSARTQQYQDMAGMLGPSKGKDFDTGNILGPVLVTADEFDPAASHAMVARINGEQWSQGNLQQMDNSFAAMISYISQNETLFPGDIIGSGTVPTGCGAELHKFPKVGDLIELEVEGIGILRNRITSPL